MHPVGAEIVETFSLRRRPFSADRRRHRQKMQTHAISFAFERGSTVKNQARFFCKIARAQLAHYGDASDL